MKFISISISNLTKYNLRTQSNLLIPRMKLQSAKKSFIPYATSLWNNLPLSTSQTQSWNIFKNKIIPKTTISNYNRLCSGYYGRLLTRLRLGLSGLNAHRFKYNLHTTPICPLCHLVPEDNYHFFINCPTHTLARLHFFNLLSSELDLDTTNHNYILNTILYCHLNHSLQPLLLKFIYQYFEVTGRFKQQKQTKFLSNLNSPISIHTLYFPALYMSTHCLGERPLAHGCSAILVISK